MVKGTLSHINSVLHSLTSTGWPDIIVVTYTVRWSHAQRDAVDGVSWDLGICFLPTNPEDHKGVGGYGGRGVQRFTQPALRATPVQFNCYL